ncbi:hypothetical protein [Priestia megaterium]|uniref:hypothetical protein n=1 Tax=Priestia megaterium TaxID=1404 RepID=UPI00101E16BD|nr:hypothetical protein [Priestia megaterium]
MIEGQGKDSCGKSGTGETPQECKRRGGSPAACGKRSLARKSIQFARLWIKMIWVCPNLILRGTFKMKNKKKYLNNYMISYIIAKRMRS